MWIWRNEWKCNIQPVHCPTNKGKGRCAQAACDTLVFPAPQMWVVSAIRCYMREMKLLVSFLCTAFCFAYFKSVRAHWDRSGNKRIGKFKIIRVSCSELCVLLNELQNCPLKLAKAATVIWLFPALQGNLTEVLIGVLGAWMQKGGECIPGVSCPST